MCFSAEVSFGAAVVLGSVGVLSIRKAPTAPFKLFACIPLLFAIQQTAEGFVWLSLSYNSLVGLRQFFTYFFILFAWGIWPFLVPFVFLKIEKNKFRKKLLLALCLVGGLVSGLLLFVMLRHEVYAEVVDCSIKYAYNFNYSGKYLLATAYVSVTILPALISSLPLSWVLGVLNLLGYFFSRIQWEDNVISVWCFFAAISSLFIYYLIDRQNNRSTS